MYYEAHESPLSLFYCRNAVCQYCSQACHDIPSNRWPFQGNFCRFLNLRRSNELFIHILQIPMSCPINQAYPYSVPSLLLVCFPLSILRITPNSARSAVSLFVSTERIPPTETIHRWKAIGIGEISLQIHPACGHTTEWYYLGILGCHFGYNQFSFSIGLSHACCDFCWWISVTKTS